MSHHIRIGRPPARPPRRIDWAGYIHHAIIGVLGALLFAAAVLPSAPDTDVPRWTYGGQR